MMKKRRNKAVKLFAFIAVFVVLLSAIPLSAFASTYSAGIGDGGFENFSGDGEYPSANDFVSSASQYGFSYVLVLNIPFYMEEQQSASDLEIMFYSFDNAGYIGEAYNSMRVRFLTSDPFYEVYFYSGSQVVDYLEVDYGDSPTIWIGFDHYTFISGDVDAFYYTRVIYTLPQQTVLGNYSAFRYGEGYEDGYQTAGGLNYDNAYNFGYNTGFGDGEGSGYAVGYDDGYLAGSEGDPIGFESGYEAGYAAGSVRAVDNSTSWNNFFFSAVNAPVQVARRLFSVEVFGISVWSIMVSLLMVCLVLIIIKAVTK